MLDFPEREIHSETPRTLECVRMSETNPVWGVAQRARVGRPSGMLRAFGSPGFQRRGNDPRPPFHSGRNDHR